MSHAVQDKKGLLTAPPKLKHLVFVPLRFFLILDVVGLFYFLGVRRQVISEVFFHNYSQRFFRFVIPFCVVFYSVFP